MEVLYHLWMFPVIWYFYYYVCTFVIISIKYIGWIIHCCKHYVYKCISEFISREMNNLKDMI